MWSKIYLSVLGLSLVVTAFFTFYSFSWLKSIGAPQAAIEGYLYHTGIAWPALWITAAVLLLVANAVLWTTKRSWAMWTTLVYFAIGVVVRYFWLEAAAASFRTTNGLAAGSVSFGPLLAVAIIVVAAALVFFDYFLVLRLHERTFPNGAAAAGSEESRSTAEPI